MPQSTPSISPVLITAGPTHEPLDEVRFIGNRSSGRMGLALARAALDAGCNVRLLLGPVLSVSISLPLSDRLQVERFTTCAQLQSLLNRFWPGEARTLIMAAAVADYRPVEVTPGKLQRRPDGLTLRLEATPDLVAQCASRKVDSSRQTIGFALESPDQLEKNAFAKMRKKNLDVIVANPLATIESNEVDAAIIWADGTVLRPGRMDKGQFAVWLIEQLMARRSAPPV